MGLLHCCCGLPKALTRVGFNGPVCKALPAKKGMTAMTAKTLLSKSALPQTILASCVLLLFCMPASASLQTLDLTTGGAAGTALDGGGSYNFAGVTLAASANVGVVNATASRMGINIVGDGGDDSDEIDFAFGEELTFTITFAGPLSVSLTSLDLVGVGPSAGDEANLTFSGSPTVVLQTGATDFNGSTDVWTPAGGVSIASGDTILFQAGTKFGLEGIAFDVNTIPEPASMFVWTLIAGGCVFCRSRR